MSRIGFSALRRRGRLLSTIVGATVVTVGLALGGFGIVAYAQVPPPSAPTAPDAEAPAPQPATSTPAAKPDPIPETQPVAAPSDPLAAKAYATLETHCARCHQAGRLKGSTPAAGFGNILRLTDLTRDPALVRPGNPDASRLYTHVLRRLMPYDVYQEASGGAEPTSEDVQAIRDWIEHLTDAPGCPDRRPVTQGDIAAAIRSTVQAAGADALRYRFISLAHLYNACASSAEMFAHRQGLTALVNSVSWRPEPIALVAIDEARTIYRLDLADLNWLPAHWDHITRSGVNAAGHLERLPADVTKPLGAEHPIARGDWLADTVLRAPLYYDLLGLPSLGSEIARILQLDLTAARRGGQVERAQLRESEISRSARVIERLRATAPMLWTTFDAVPRTTPQGTLLPAAPSETAHDTSLGIYSLPNGFPAFFALSGRGERTDRVNADLLRGHVTGRQAFQPGLSCLGCNANGPLAPKPEHVATPGNIARLIEADRAATHQGLAKALAAPDYAIDGLPPVAYLARQMQRPVGLVRAAAELGVSPDALRTFADSADTPTAILARRIVQGIITRSEFDAATPALLQALSPSKPDDGAPATPATEPRLVMTSDPLDPGPDVRLVSSQSVYKAGDALKLSVTTSADCHLTVISVDQRGRGTVIFPNDFEPAGLVLAKRTLRLPADSAPYTLRLKEKGRETVVAICNRAGGSVDGIQHDFERQRFTDLGNYGAFVAQAREGRSLPPLVEPRPPARKRGAAPPPETAAAKPAAGQITHTAITIEVR